MEVWQFTADNSLWGPPSSNEDLLFLPSMDHSLYALDPATGTVVWQKEFEGALASMPTQEAGTLLCRQFEQQCLCSRRRDGFVALEGSDQRLGLE